uniref:peptidoglycan recognition protein family protein n=1 Tax=Porcipelethomonas ammoniilytica TaxID=2981722 RepID=UPI00374CBFA9
MNNTVYEKLIQLCTDICKRYSKTKVLWLGSKEKTLAYTPKSNEMVLTAHRWFANKSCPGDWLYSRYGELASRINALLGSSSNSISGSTGSTENSGILMTSYTVRFFTKMRTMRSCSYVSFKICYRFCHSLLLVAALFTNIF